MKTPASRKSFWSIPAISTQEGKVAEVRASTPPAEFRFELIGDTANAMNLYGRNDACSLTSRLTC